MEKKLASAEDLRTLVQDAVNSNPAVRDESEQLIVHEPVWHDADEEGCNWTIVGYMGLGKYGDPFRAALQSVRSTYNLKA